MYKTSSSFSVCSTDGGNLRCMKKKWWSGESGFVEIRREFVWQNMSNEEPFWRTSYLLWPNNISLQSLLHSLTSLYPAFRPYLDSSTAWPTVTSIVHSKLNYCNCLNINYSITCAMLYAYYLTVSVLFNVLILFCFCVSLNMHSVKYFAV